VLTPGFLIFCVTGFVYLFLRIRYERDEEIQRALEECTAALDRGLHEVAEERASRTKSSQPEQKAQAKYVLGLVQFQRRNYCDAEKLLTDGLSHLEPGHPYRSLFLVLLAWSQVQQKNYEAAEKTIADIRRLADGPPVATRRAQRYDRLGRFHYSAFRARAEALRIRAWIHLQHREWKEAEELAKQAEQGLAGEESHCPERVLALDLLGRAYFSQGRFKAAAAVIEQALELAEKTGLLQTVRTQALFALSCTRVHQREYEAALETSQRLLTMVECDVLRYAVLNNLGVVHYKLRRHEEADGYYQESMEIAKRLDEGEGNRVGKGLSNLSLVFLREKRYAEAEDSVQRAIAILEPAPASVLVSAINNYAMLCRELGREAEAIAFDARARELEHLQDPIEVATDLEATAEHLEDL
jgi:tetratricopeptide (TPR) repeat protein